MARCQILELGWVAVDAVAFLVLGVGHTVDGLADDVEQTSVDVLTYGHGDGAVERDDFGAALQTVGAVHGNGAHGVLANVLLAFQYHFRAVGAYDLQCIIDVG